MCEYVFEQRPVKTRKPQKCWGCAREFPKGTTLRFQTTVDNGHFQKSYWCPVCNEYWNQFMDGDDRVGFGELRDADKVAWEEVRQEVEDNTTAE